MAVIRTKPTVRFGGITAGLIELLRSLEELSRSPLLDWLPPELVITAGSDGTHATNSRHYTYEAIDVRSKNFPSLARKQEFRRRWEAQLEARFPGKFRVLLESVGSDNEHFHAQVKKGQTFPV